jgi:hypothetical protein
LLLLECKAKEHGTITTDKFAVVYIVKLIYPILASRSAVVATDPDGRGLAVVQLEKFALG